MHPDKLGRELTMDEQRMFDELQLASSTCGDVERLRSYIACNDHAAFVRKAEAKATKEDSTTDTARLRQEARAKAEEHRARGNVSQPNQSAGRGRSGGGGGGRRGHASSSPYSPAFGSEGEIPESRRIESGAPAQCSKPRFQVSPREGRVEVWVGLEWSCATVDSDLFYELQVRKEGRKEGRKESMYHPILVMTSSTKYW